MKKNLKKISFKEFWQVIFLYFRCFCRRKRSPGSSRWSGSQTRTRTRTHCSASRGRRETKKSSSKSQALFRSMESVQRLMELHLLKKLKIEIIFENFFYLLAFRHKFIEGAPSNFSIRKKWKKGRKKGDNEQKVLSQFQTFL